MILKCIAFFRYKLFEKHGSYNNTWNQALFEIEPCNEDFQIIIEATTGKALLSDIAIDDFELLTDGECIAEEIQTTAVIPVTVGNNSNSNDGGIYNIQSCSNRCDEIGPSTAADEIITNGTGRGGILEHCDCFDGCEDIKSCCPDYITTCVFCKEGKKKHIFIDRYKLY